MTDIQQSRLVIEFYTGMNSAGKDTFKKKTFPNISSYCEDEALAGAAAALISLQQHHMMTIIRSNEYMLEQTDR